VIGFIYGGRKIEAGNRLGYGGDRGIEGEAGSERVHEPAKNVFLATGHMIARDGPHGRRAAPGRRKAGH